ncbi:hypothetical protein GOODEAATRI_009479 [Goodea atripinnis]|uniref:Uncharacterized protein n=1 Tax=Goodea atripinnis TaxID=208336 RepID=A0ABV0P2R3_9TELE
MSEQVLTTFSLCYNRRWETPHPLSLLPQKNGCPVRLRGRSLTFLSTVLLHVGKVYKRLRSQIKSTGNGPAHTGDGKVFPLLFCFSCNLASHHFKNCTL